jgi:hypothetical protein
MASDRSLEELLGGLFNLPAGRARYVASRMMRTQFEANLQQLEASVGIDRAWRIVERGHFLDYGNGDVQVYLGLVRKLQDGAGRKKGAPADEDFYSIASLQRRLAPGADEAVLRIAPEHRARYKLLQEKDRNARRYLKRLCEDGELAVPEFEHWSLNKEKGARGLDILRKITYEMAGIFDELGLAKPVRVVNYGQRKLSIDEQTRRELQRIRDAAYGKDEERK